MAAVPLPAAMAAPLPMMALVGQQFCAPYVVALTVTKKTHTFSDNEFFVSDVNGAILMKVKDRFLTLHSHCVLCNAEGIPIISIRKKMMSMHHRWKVYRGDSSDEKDLVFTVKQSHFLQLKTELDVFLPGNDRICDFKVKGNSSGGCCTFYLRDSNTIIALMSGQCIIVYPNVDYALIVAIMTILDRIMASHSGSLDAVDAIDAINVITST